MAQDCWIPRITLLSQVVLLVTCAVLIALGNDSVITDLFCAGAGATLGTHLVSAGLKKVTTQSAAPAASDQDTETPK